MFLKFCDLEYSPFLSCSLTANPSGLQLGNFNDCLYFFFSCQVYNGCLNFLHTKCRLLLVFDFSIPITHLSIQLSSYLPLNFPTSFAIRLLDFSPFCSVCGCCNQTSKTRSLLLQNIFLSLSFPMSFLFLNSEILHYWIHTWHIAYDVLLLMERVFVMFQGLEVLEIRSGNPDSA